MEFVCWKRTVIGFMNKQMEALESSMRICEGYDYAQLIDQQFIVLIALRFVTSITAITITAATLIIFTSPPMVN